jgi:hypothetical protein
MGLKEGERGNVGELRTALLACLFEKWQSYREKAHRRRTV